MDAFITNILDRLDKKERRALIIVETDNDLYGSTATQTVARWISQTSPSSCFYSVGMNGAAQEKQHRVLEALDLSVYCTFRTVMASKYLNDLSWIDLAILHPDDLAEGVEQFSLSMSAGASVVLIRDYQHAGAKAVERAKKLGWHVNYEGDYSILERQ
jgi:hypothetical protein